MKALAASRWADMQNGSAKLGRVLSQWRTERRRGALNTVLQQ